MEIAEALQIHFDVPKVRVIALVMVEVVVWAATAVGATVRVDPKEAVDPIEVAVSTAQEAQQIQIRRCSYRKLVPMLKNHCQGEFLEILIAFSHERAS